jgi:hypothetical protein
MSSASGSLLVRSVKRRKWHNPISALPATWVLLLAAVNGAELAPVPQQAAFARSPARPVLTGADAM